MESENYKKVKDNTPLYIQIKVLEDISEKQKKYIEELEKQSKLFGVGIELPTEEEMFSESQKRADKYSQGVDVQGYNAFNRGFEKCYRWIKDKEK